MTARTEYPDAGRLRDVIPVFPLSGVLLMPGGQLPLNIFEPRYVSMTIDAMGAGRLIGMIQPAPGPGVEARDPDFREQPPLCQVGCAGRIVSFSETGDGRLLITLLGLTRFHIGRELAMEKGYRRVEALYAAFEQDLTGGGGPDAQLDRVGLIKAAAGYFKSQGFDANWTEIERLADSELLASLAMACPLDGRDKQALLECADPAGQARLLTELLTMAAHGEAVGLKGAAH
ncbi:MAG: LON peptidase substrate-binding domain-containing protein [Rhodospirillaceae bacterium]